jgi:SAM-dependent methyltransferase
MLSQSSCCPICKSHQVEQLYAVTIEEAAQHFVLLEEDEERHKALASHLEQLWNADSCHVCKCQNCNFGFSDPYIAGDAEFYRLAYTRTRYPSAKWEYRRTLQAMEARAFEGQRVLEVAAGFGYFLDLIVGKYVPPEGITALEFDGTSLEVLRRKGYRAIAGDIRSSNLVAGYDAIFLFQVLEHLDNLDALFARLSQLLLDQGRVFIAVPNPRRIDFQESTGSLLDMPPNHVGRWSDSAFETIAGRANLKVESIEVEPFSFGSFIVEDLKFSYSRKAQQSGTLINWSRSLRTTRTGRLVGAAFAFMTIPTRFPTWLRGLTAADLGASTWVELSKNVDSNLVASQHEVSR